MGCFFFDAVNLEWDYEPEGFDLDDSGKYLPDFWVPIQNHTHKNAGYFVEIKPLKEGGLTDEEEKKASALATKSMHNCVVLCGRPWPGELEVFKFNNNGTKVHFTRDNELLSGSWGYGFYITYPVMVSLMSKTDHNDYCRAFNGGLMSAANKALSARFEHGGV